MMVARGKGGSNGSRRSVVSLPQSGEVGGAQYVLDAMPAGCILSIGKDKVKVEADQVRGLSFPLLSSLPPLLCFLSSLHVPRHIITRSVSLVRLNGHRKDNTHVPFPNDGLNVLCFSVTPIACHRSWRGRRWLSPRLSPSCRGRRRRR